jgi:hypothetical protein
MSATTEQKTQLVEGIRDYLSRNEYYSFRPTKIDGHNVYIFIYDKFKIVTIESIFVKCKVKINNADEVQNYSLFHFEYTTLEEAIDRIETVKKEYKLYNGELVPEHLYKLSKLEECIIPYSEEEKCSVCFEDTSDTTLCNHTICLTCREVCIMNKRSDCPMCRNAKALHYYSNKYSLINNEIYTIVKRAIHSEKGYHIEAIPHRVLEENSESEEDEENEEDDLEIVEWTISREPAFVFRPSTQIEDGEIIEDDRMDVDTYDEGSIMNPINIDDLMRNQ